MCSIENKLLADKVLTMVTRSLSNYPFNFQGARIITGQEEGAYGWITINYLLGKFTKVIISQHTHGGDALGPSAVAISGTTCIASQGE